MPGKRIHIDDESWSQLRLMALDRMMTFQELADEAFADLLKKHGHPVDLRAALRKSAGAGANVVQFQKKSKGGSGPKTKSRQKPSDTKKP